MVLDEEKEAINFDMFRFRMFKVSQKVSISTTCAVLS
ncbi:unnamed protein product, partial [Rotaria sp. Silwood1]